MKGHPISQRRVCVLIGVDPKTVRREHPPDNPEVRLEMNKIAEKRRRFGYRRIGIMLERVGSSSARSFSRGRLRDPSETINGSKRPILSPSSRTVILACYLAGSMAAKYISLI